MGGSGRRLSGASVSSPLSLQGRTAAKPTSLLISWLVLQLVFDSCGWSNIKYIKCLIILMTLDFTVPWNNIL